VRKRRPRADLRRAAGTVAILAALVSPAMAESPATRPPSQSREEVNLATFDRAWSLIADTHWDPTLGGLDWAAVRDELRPKAGDATNDRELRRVIEEMLARLGQSHFALLPDPATDDPTSTSDEDAGGLPGCSAASSAEIFAAMERRHSGDGDPGLELRLLDRDQVVVTRVVAGTPAAAAGVRTGWRLLAIDGAPLERSLECIRRVDDVAFQRQIEISWLRGLLAGPAGSDVRARFHGGSHREMVLRRAPPPGEVVRFGNLPPAALQFERTSAETRQRARVAVVRFNIWLPPVSAAFESAMSELRAADGVVIDLRGNPGGVSAVAQGVAGHFVAETISLGTMKGRRDHLELVAQPRRVARDGSTVEPYGGPLAILIDEGSASTSELFAAGLRDHDRARLFGSPSAGAALPAVMDRLPNGDVFMHASMDYIRPNGERVEGRPVVPDVTTPLRRADLRAGTDAALEAALSWIDEEL
jgi:carboxyl-terminal processing protease